MATTEITSKDQFQTFAMETSHSVILFVHDNTDVSVSIFLEAPLTGGTKAVVYVDKDPRLVEFAKGLSGLPLIGSYQNGQKMNEMTGMDPETIMDIIQGLSA